MKSFAAHKAYVFDLDGTLYLGDRLLEGARELTERLLRSGRRVYYFTNNTSRGNDEYVRRLRTLGLPEPGHIFTPGNVAKDWLAEHLPGGKVFCFATRSFADWMAEDVTTAREDADAVLLAMHKEVNWADFVTLCNLLQEGKPFLVTHPDPACPDVPYPVPDAGAFYALAKTCTGRAYDVLCGKPTREAGRSLEKLLGLPPEDICMVGDRYSSDILFGKNNGYYTVHVQTGAREDLTGLEPADLVTDSVADLLGQF